MFFGEVGSSSFAVLGFRGGTFGHHISGHFSVQAWSKYSVLKLIPCDKIHLYSLTDGYMDNKYECGGYLHSISNTKLLLCEILPHSDGFLC